MKASICIGTHNSQDFIIDTLNSVKSQTMQDFEVIIVDDHSTDSTCSIISEICKKDNRFKLFVNLTTAKYVDAMNLSYELAEGEYLFRLDHDDIMPNNYVEYACNWLDNNPNVDAVCLPIGELICDNGVWTKTSKQDNIHALAQDIENFNDYPLDYFYYAFYMGKFNVWHNNSSVIRKKFLIDHPADKYYWLSYGDYKFWMKCLFDGCIMKFINNEDSPILLNKHYGHNTYNTNTEFCEKSDSNNYVLSLLFLRGMTECNNLYKYLKDNNLQIFKNNIEYFGRTLPDDIKSSYQNIVNS